MRLFERRQHTFPELDIMVQAIIPSPVEPGVELFLGEEPSCPTSPNPVKAGLRSLYPIIKRVNKREFYKSRPDVRPERTWDVRIERTWGMCV